MTPERFERCAWAAMIATAAILLLIVSGGCAAGPHPPAPTIGMPALFAGQARWRAEFQRVYHVDPLIVDCHGADVDGHWALWINHHFLDAASVAWTMRALHPERPVLIIACNPGGYRLSTPGVYYPLDDVWNAPGPDLRFADGDWEDCVGNIDEFVHDHTPGR